ncbi:hypothetical protein Vadar_031817 [Vaccinium darrowii]|uniref:Uncharacterized protein n=1 Tax=Vaccinium darrowii TaxID=229202 RepID=A0ACB7YQX9_9ERIC|nr:hypothetical protein Vadar_031817 [Vaccinium darrowii]
MGIGESASLMSALVLGMVAITSTLISMFLVDKLGRRILLMAGGIQMLVSQVMIGVVLASQSADNGGLNKGFVVLVLSPIKAKAVRVSIKKREFTEISIVKHLIVASSKSFGFDQHQVLSVQREELYLDTDPVDTTTILLTQHSSTSAGPSSQISSTNSGPSLLPQMSAATLHSQGQQLQYTPVSQLGGQFVSWQPQMPSYGGYNGHNSGGNNRTNRNNNGNRFKSRNSYQQGNNYQHHGYQQGVFFNAGACQICGRDNHQAYSCHYRQNLNYRPPSYTQYGPPQNSTSQNVSQFAQQGMQGSLFSTPGHNFSQGYSTQRPPQAQALMVSSDTTYQGLTPTFQGYSMPQQQQIAYSPTSLNMSQPYTSGVSTPLQPTAANPLPPTPLASSTAVPWVHMVVEFVGVVDSERDFPVGAIIRLNFSSITGGNFVLSSISPSSRSGLPQLASPPLFSRYPESFQQERARIVGDLCAGGTVRMCGTTGSIIFVNY